MKAAKQMIEYQKMVIDDQERATSIGLDFTQTEANRTALQAIIDTKAEKLAQALKDFEDGEPARFRRKEEVDELKARLFLSSRP